MIGDRRPSRLFRQGAWNGGRRVRRRNVVVGLAHRGPARSNAGCLRPRHAARHRHDFETKARWMIYNGAAVRERLTALRDALTAAKERTELDPFDEAMFNAIHAMLDVSQTHSTVVESIVKSARKVERRLR